MISQPFRTKYKKSTLLKLALAGAVSALVGYAVAGAFLKIAIDPIDDGFLTHRRMGSSSSSSSSSSSTSRSLTPTVTQGQTIHTLCTTNGSPYQNYQMRIAYASYRVMQKMPGGDRHTAFTRILHRTNRDRDILEDEIPTFRADPLQPACDDWCEYPVSDRANAVKQFWQHGKDAGLLKEDWFYMIESDYVFVKPLELPQGKHATDKAYGFSFYYINPSAHAEEMKILYPGGDPSTVASTGPAPILMTLDTWLDVTDVWERMTALIESEETIKKKLGWVREMYGFSVALAIKGIDIVTDRSQENRFICEPPIFDGLGNAHAFHYTLPTIFKTLQDEDVWGYDKRAHVEPSEVVQIPNIEPPPPFKQGQWKFIEGNPVTREKYDTIAMMISYMNKAISTLKPLQ